jgi:hypothetical protein
MRKGGKRELMGSEGKLNIGHEVEIRRVLG